MIDFLFRPDPAGNIPGTWFEAWRSTEGPTAAFRVGMRTYYQAQQRWGLSFYGTDDDPAYDPADHSGLGSWAQLLDVTVRGEGRGRFTTLNTWDRAAFTFGFLQFAAHEPDGDFIQWFRALLKRPEANDYFPTLKIVNGRIADANGPIETAQSTARLMAFLNPNGDRVDAAEILNAARFIDWTRRIAEARSLQVDVAASIFRSLLKHAATKVALDGESDAICSVVADILHQGRGGSDTWQLIGDALASSDKLGALLAIGADSYPERCQAIAAIIRDKLAAGLLGGSAYDAASHDFRARHAGPGLAAPGLAAPAAWAPPAAEGLTADGEWIAFEHAPFSASHPPGNKVFVSVPNDFKPARPFVVTLFLCGHDLPTCTQLHQIEMIPAQVRASRTNTVLLAPRFGQLSESGSFAAPGALNLFIEEASGVVAKVLSARGTAAADGDRVRDYLASQAPIFIVSFRGGCHTLRFLLKNEADLAPRLRGVQLLDSIYGSGSEPQPQQAIADWIQGALDRSWLVSLYGPSTQTEPHNKFVMLSLTGAGVPYKEVDDWSQGVATLTPGTIAFSTTQEHCEVPLAGPPEQPVQAMLDRLDAAFAK
jgi:hypothetical protein